MYPQMFFTIQIGHHGVGQPSISYLNGVAVLDEAGHVVPDALRLIGQRNGGKFEQGFVVAENIIHILDMNETVAVDAGHVVH